VACDHLVDQIFQHLYLGCPTSQETHHQIEEHIEQIKTMVILNSIFLMTLTLFNIKRSKYGQLYSQSWHPPPGHKGYSSGHTARGLYLPAAWPNPVGWGGMELCLNLFDLQVEQ
jgi:hypothetical protein